MTTPERLGEQPASPETVQPVEQSVSSEQVPASSSTQPSADQQAPTSASDASQVQKQDGAEQAVSVPATNQEQLEKISKGSPEDSRTWFGAMWIRKIKKALHRRIKVIFKGA